MKMLWVLFFSCLPFFAQAEPLLNSDGAFQTAAAAKLGAQGGTNNTAPKKRKIPPKRAIKPAPPRPAPVSQENPMQKENSENCEETPAA